MKFRVDMKYGYIIFDEKDEDKAWELYRENENSIRIRKCKDFHDEGIVIHGLPIIHDLSDEKKWNRN